MTLKFLVALQTNICVFSIKVTVALEIPQTTKGVFLFVCLFVFSFP